MELDTKGRKIGAPPKPQGRSVEPAKATPIASEGPGDLCPRVDVREAPPGRFQRDSVGLGNEVTACRNVTETDGTSRTVLETDGTSLIEKKRLGMTYAELSSALSIPKSTLAKWVMEKRIPFVKLGHLVRFQPEEIEAWLKQRSHDVSR